MSRASAERAIRIRWAVIAVSGIWLIILTIAMAVLSSGCESRRKYHIVKKTASEKVYRTADDRYFIYHDSVLYYWMMFPNSSGNLSGSFSYSDAYASPTVPNFSQGAFVPVTNTPATAMDQVIEVPVTEDVTAYEVTDSSGAAIAGETLSGAISTDEISEGIYESSGGSQEVSTEGSESYSVDSESTESSVFDSGSADSSSSDSSSSDFGGDSGGDCGGDSGGDCGGFD